MNPVDRISEGLNVIERKFMDSHEQLSVKQRELQDEILQLKQRGALQPGNPAEGFASKGDSLGNQVVKMLDENRDLLAKTRQVRFEVKAAGDVVTTTSGRNIVTGGVGAPTGLPFGVQNGLTINPANGVSAIEYFRYSGIEGAAAVQAGEGASKPAVRPTHTAITQAALTIAGWTKLSRQAMNDSAELRQAIDVTLRREVGKALDLAVMTANVTPAWSGLKPLATAYTSLVYTTLWDAASEAVSTMMIAGFVPDIVVLGPAEWLTCQVAQNVGGDYLSGSYLGQLPENLRGLRVIVSPNMDAGKVMVLDSTQVELKLVEDFAVEVAYVDDDFIKNQVTVLGELRVIPVFRSVGSARLITPKA
ncbi:MAG TPA: phage major capsid protein [Azoarcus taiwanensis]|nr:phage major capsid protein [Rhodocyclaceae bacterium]HRQ59673.1 phage major capsid protein [Azoarcus taiwanensis]